MNHHLNPEEVIRFADEEIANGRRSEAMEHLEACAPCRRQVEFQRALRRSAERELSAAVSKRFTANVLRAVGVREPKNILGRLSDNLGSLFALLMVVGLFGIIATYLSSFDARQSGQGSGFWGEMGQQVQSFTGQVRSLLPAAVVPSKRPSMGDAADILSPSAVALVILLGLDMLLSRYQGIRLRKRQ